MEDEKADVLVLANSSLGTPVAARIAAKTGAGLASNVVDIPNTSGGFVVTKSIYTGKAFAVVALTTSQNINAIRKNAAEAKETGSAECCNRRPN
jgi:electron transfer flavoprotein alpha subunit